MTFSALVTFSVIATSSSLYLGLPLSLRQSRNAFMQMENARNVEKFQQNQFRLMLDNHCGSFQGIQTGYDPENVEVADYMYCGSELIVNKESTEISHTNTFVVGEIRAGLI